MFSISHRAIKSENVARGRPAGGVLLIFKNTEFWNFQTFLLVEELLPTAEYWVPSVICLALQSQKMPFVLALGIRT